VDLLADSVAAVVVAHIVLEAAEFEVEKLTEKYPLFAYVHT
jgi:hypothetical protein